MIIIFIIVYFIGLGMTYIILEEVDEWDGHTFVFLLFIVIWPISLLVLIGNKIGKKISHWFTIVILMLFLSSCAHSICKDKIKMVKKDIKHHNFYK